MTGTSGGLNFSLSDEQEMIVRTMRAFVEQELYPHEATVERLCAVPKDIYQEIRAKALHLGLYAMNFPTHLGGGGLAPTTMALVDRELGRTSIALQYIAARPSTILREASGTQIDEFLKPTVSGERIECVAMTEPSAGSDLRSMRTSAIHDRSDFVINGTKHFISKADIADYIILFAATGSEETENGTRSKVSAFFVDKDTPGVTVRRGYECVSHRGYNNSIIVFEEARVPSANLIGELHRGLSLAGDWLSSARLQVAAMCLGRAERAFEFAQDWANTRVQFGKAIIQNQAIAFRLADMATQITAGTFLTLQAAHKVELGRSTRADSAMAKLFVSEMLGNVADSAVQILGGMGVMEEHPIARIWRDARVERIWDGTSEIQRSIISRELQRSYASQIGRF